MRFFRYFLFLILALFFLGNFNQASAISDQKILISKVSNTMIEITNLGDNLSFSKIEIIQKNKIIGEISNGVFLKKSQISFGENGDGELILNPELLKSQIKLRIDGQDVDFLCGLKMTCKNKNAPEFTEEDVLVRDLNLGGDFEISKEGVVFKTGGLAEKEPDFCENIQLNEVLANSSEQFIEFKNNTNKKINLKNCAVEIHLGSLKKPYKKVFTDEEILPNSFFSLDSNADPNFKLLKMGLNKISLLDSNNQEIQTVDLKNSKKDLSWIFNGKEWSQSFKIAKNSKNIFQPCEDGFNLNLQGQCEKIKVCEDGYFLNEETGRCNKIKEEKLEKEKTEKIENDEKTEKKCSDGYFLNPQTNRCNKMPVEKVATTECRDGYVRSPETNRCRKIATLASSSKELAVCAPGYTRNPITNRCRKNSSDAKKEITPCKDGYERNPETNRCRKIVKNNGANNEVEKDEKESKQAEFTGWWAIVIIILIFLAILFFEFRRDIFAKLMKGKK